MAARDYAKDVADHLATVITGATTTPSTTLSGTWLICYGMLVDRNQPQICCLNSGGFPSEPTFEQDRVEYPTVQVIVRGLPGDYTNANAKALEVMDNLGTASITVNTITYLVSALGGPQPPFFLGLTDKREAQFSINRTLGRAI